MEKSWVLIFENMYRDPQIIGGLLMSSFTVYGKQASCIFHFQGNKLPGIFRAGSEKNIFSQEAWDQFSTPKIYQYNADCGLFSADFMGDYSSWIYLWHI